MNSKQIVIGLAALFVTVGSPAVAESIYKWTDADGNVHYEDRPSATDNVERIQVVFNRGNRNAAQNPGQNNANAQSDGDDAETPAANKKKTAAEKRAEAEDRKNKCQSYRAKLETMVQSRRLYREDENGERVYLDDTQRSEARAQAEALVNEYCNS